jgi:mannose-6-phosphate isomerase
MTPVLQFKPLYQQRVWGGHILESWLGRRHVLAGPIGESWEIVDRPEAQSVVAVGPWAGRSLRDLIESDPAAILGPGWPAERRFPILVKWLDCRERLSLQVHPPAEIAGRLGGEPKTENWYFARTDEGAAVFAGLRDGVTDAAFEQALADGTAEACMRRLPVAAGDSLLIRSGVMHAIDAGNVILEIQQNSDTTYRVYDWGRVGLDGQPRALHVAESLECLRASRGIPVPELADRAAEVPAECAEFRLRRQCLPAGGRLGFAAGEQARILSVVAGRLEGAGLEGDGLRLGDNALLPHAGQVELVAAEPAVVLITENFCAS